MEKVLPRRKSSNRGQMHLSVETEGLSPLHVVSPVLAPPSIRQKRISLNLWRSEVIPAVNRVSLQVSAEERRKLEQGMEEVSFQFMWSPESKIRLSWDATIAICTVFLAWRLPYSLAFENDIDFQEQPWISALNTFVNVLYVMDVVANFRTGYSSDIEVIMDPKKVAINYIKTWFLIDVAGSVPFELFIKTNDDGIGRKAVKTSLKYLKIPKLFRLARVIRFVRKHMQFMYTFQISLIFVSIVHWIACLLPNMITIDDYSSPPFTKYGIYLYISVCTMFNIGRIENVSYDEHFTMATLSVLGFFWICLVLSSITAIFVSKSSRASEYQDKVRAVMSDLKALQVPRELRQAAKNYYEMLWRVKKTSDRYEKFIYDDHDLSPQIRAEIALHIHRRAIAVVPLFKGCTDDCLATVVMRLKTNLYMAHDVIFHKGEPGRSMLIIIRGKVEIIGVDNRSLIAVLKEGSFFGEIGLLQNTARSCTVVAATFCEMKSLDQADAEVIFALYPHILERLYRESDRRKRDNSTKNSFCSIKVLDNAHTVDKDSIDHLPASPSQRSSRESKQLHGSSTQHLPHHGSKSSLIMNLEKHSWTEGTSPLTQQADAPTLRMMETLANVRLDVDDLKDIMMTVLDNQKLLVEKMTELESKSHHTHRRRQKETNNDGTLTKKSLESSGSIRGRDLLRMTGTSDRSIKTNGALTSNETEDENLVVNRLMVENDQQGKRPLSE